MIRRVLSSGKSTGRRRRRKLFSSAARATMPRMIGAFLNALGILLGAFSGLVRRGPPAARAQHFSRAALGVLTVLAGLRLLWLSLNGTVSAGVKQFLLAALAVVLGYWTGKALGLQKI